MERTPPIVVEDGARIPAQLLEIVERELQARHRGQDGQSLPATPPGGEGRVPARLAADRAPAM